MPPSFGSSGVKPEPTRLRQIALVVEDLQKAKELLVRRTLFFVSSNLSRSNIFVTLYPICMIICFINSLSIISVSVS
jgi:hypothetical protein